MQNKENAYACFVCTSIRDTIPNFSFAPVAAPAECARCSCTSVAVNEPVSDSPGHSVNKKDSAQPKGILRSPCARRECRTASRKPKVTFEPMPRMTQPTGQRLYDPVSAESLGGLGGGKRSVVDPIQKHNHIDAQRGDYSLKESGMRNP